MRRKPIFPTSKALHSYCDTPTDTTAKQFLQAPKKQKHKKGEERPSHGLGPSKRNIVQPFATIYIQGHVGHSNLSKILLQTSVLQLADRFNFLLRQRSPMSDLVTQKKTQCTEFEQIPGISRLVNSTIKTIVHLFHQYYSLKWMLGKGENSHRKKNQTWKERRNLSVSPDLTFFE